MELFLIIGIIILAVALLFAIVLVFRKNNTGLERTLKEEIRLLREENDRISRLNREELSGRLEKNQQLFLQQNAQQTSANEERLENIRRTLQVSISQMNSDNTKQLEKMREVVDEKLQSTLEKRLNDSFSVVSQRLEQVYKGLGEMQTLATGVGDLKKVMQNVRTRGIWGETQLELIMEQILTPSQYEKNVAVKPRSDERVEFAVILPGDGNNTVYLPIDCKFPQEDYIRLIDASENADVEGVKAASKQLEDSIKKEANRIAGKYIAPPYTTDFAVMYLPVEGLYAEVLRIPGLFDELQRKRIMVSGPTTFSAFINSLGVGFKTLAIEKRSSEVWRLLGAVKMEFGKFGDLLEKTEKKLQETQNVIAQAASKSRNISGKLNKVEELPDSSELFDEEQ